MLSKSFLMGFTMAGEFGCSETPAARGVYQAEDGS